MGNSPEIILTLILNRERLVNTGPCATVMILTSLTSLFILQPEDHRPNFSFDSTGYKEVKNAVQGCYQTIDQ